MGPKPDADRPPCSEGFCCGAAQKFLKDGTKLAIETCQKETGVHLHVLPTIASRCNKGTNSRDLEIPMHLWCSEARCRCYRRSRRQLHDGLRGLVSTEVRRPKGLNSMFRASFDIL